MHPRALLDACAELVGQTLKFDHPADAIVSRYFRQHRTLGPRERATLAETVYAVLRKKLLFDHFAPSGSGPKERRLAILGFAHSQDDAATRVASDPGRGPRDFLRSALTDQEKHWLDQCDQVEPAELLERHRHNLPEWLVQPLKEQLQCDFWPLANSLLQPAGLDLRVNTLVAKRAELQKELARAGIPAIATPYSPWGLRVRGKPAVNKLEAFVRGALEVQVRLATAGPAARRRARRDGRGLLCRRWRQDPCHRREHAQYRAAVCIRHLGPPARRTQAPVGP